jgi:hypothetical protein
MLAAPVLAPYGARHVVRDDLLNGGTKMRAIMPLIEASPATEFVYASPAQGYAQVALALCAAAHGRRATIFTAKRKAPHPLTLRAKAAGAKVAVIVGKKDSDIGRARPIIYPAPFEANAKGTAPFPSALNYDAKGWEIFEREAPAGAVFWNASG